MLEQERQKLRAEWVDRQKQRIVDLEQKFAEMQKRFDENVARVVDAVRERELRSQLEKTARRKMQDARGEAKEEFNAAVVQTISDSQKDLGIKLESFEAVNPEKLLPGARLRVRGFNKPVILRRVDGSTAEIEAGPLRMKVAVDEITAIEAGPSGKVASAGKRGDYHRNFRARRRLCHREINVIGMTVEEATQRVDKFLDEAALANRTRVRIIHGHGTGALRRGLAEFLKTHPLVSSVSFESEDHGGKAITVVDLRS